MSFFTELKRRSVFQVGIVFWQQPGLTELKEVRREFGPYERIGYWKARSNQ